ncbi:MAG TPA: glycoside hydrolase family 15 protein [Ktedonobacterales bacterium]|jgi:glucoamylase
MTTLPTTNPPIGRHTIRLQGEPRLFVLDAGALLDSGPRAAGEHALRKLALLAESESAQVVIRGASTSVQQSLAQTLAAQGSRLSPRYAAPEEPLETLLARLGVSANETLFFLATDTPPPAGSHAFYVGSGEPPSAGAVASRMPGPQGTDALLALYGTALTQEKAGMAFRAASQGASGPLTGMFDDGLFRGLIKSYGRAAGEARTTMPAPELDGELLRGLASKTDARVLRNTLPNGAIVASPAKGEQPGEPNYWFVWQRDAGHTLRSLIAWSRTSPFGLPPEPTQRAIQGYLSFLARCQASGDLGASRYTVEGQPITGYGNPQLDGPAIGVLAMTSLPDPRPVYAQIRAALIYLLTPEGQGPCYDAWEFVYGRILNALLLKRKAFRAGARLAMVLTEQADMRRYQEEQARLEAEIEGFLDPQRGYLVSSRDPADPWLAELSGLDAATLGALLTCWDANDDFLNLTHPAVMGTALALEDAFAPLYAVNRAWLAAGHQGMGWGRFPEDANDGLGSTGGNPWPLTTLWAAQYCYLLAEKLATGGPFIVTDERQVRYFNRLVGDESARVGEQLPQEAILTDMLPALRRRGDGYAQFVLAHQPSDGSVTEQINRDSGQPQGARDLTWAMSELLNTLAMRG